MLHHLHHSRSQQFYLALTHRTFGGGIDDKLVAFFNEACAKGSLLGRERGEASCNRDNKEDN